MNRVLSCIGSLLCLLMLALPAHAQARLNLDFEPETNARQPLLLWFHYVNPECTIRLDTTVAQHGRGSLEFEVPAEADVRYSHFGTSSFPLDSARGKLLTLSGYIRTADFRGQAGLYAIVGAPEYAEHLAIEYKLDSLPRNSAWQRLQIQIPVGQAASNLALGFRLQGTGRVWLDNLQLRLDDRLYHDAALAGTEPLLASAPVDWSFEHSLPLMGGFPISLYQTSLDPEKPHTGHSSLHLEVPATAPAGAFPYLGSLALDSTAWGKKLTISGYFRQASATMPPPALTYALLFVDKRHTPSTGERRFFRQVTLPPGATSWQPFSVPVDLPVYTPATKATFAIGMHVAGPATLWVDDIQFALDGQPFKPKDPAALPPPTGLEAAWLRKASLPLASTLPTAPTTDLVGFGALVGTAHVVGLGGVTYGSQEVAQLQYRLLRYLVEQKGFTGVVLEADMAAFYRLNQYLRTGQGNAQVLLAELGAWNNQPMLALVQWLRAYNQRGGVQLQLMGSDMTSPQSVLTSLRQATSPKDTGTLAQLTTLEKQLVDLDTKQLHDNPYLPTYRKPALLGQIHTLLQELRTNPLRYRNTSLAQLAWHDQLLHLLEQYSTWLTLAFDVAPDYQAACQAENVRWLDQQLPSHKLALWGHNNFVGKEAGVGSWLTTTYGVGYFALGMTFHQGIFTGYTEGKGLLATAQPSYPGTYEAYFHAAQLPLALLDLRHLALNAATNGWLFQRLLLRDVALKDTPYNFNRHDLRREFDAVLFIDASSAALPVP